MQEPPRWLRLLLWLYPAGHRRAYGEEMWKIVRYRLAEARGPRARARAAAEAGADLVWNALRVHGLRMTRRTVMGTGGLMLDVRFVLRSLKRSPAYAATTVVVLAGAVAVNAAVLSFVRGTLLKEPTYPDADRVVAGWGSNPLNGQLRDVVSGPNLIEMRERATTIESLAAFHVDGVALEVDGRPVPLTVSEVSVDFFDAVPVRPLLGRVFGPAERFATGPAHVIATHAFWRDHMGSDPNAVGRSVPLDGEPHTVIGVLPEDFEFLLPVSLFVPLGDDVLSGDDRYRIHYHIIGRLRDGATPADASRELSAVMADIAEEYPRFEGWSVLVERIDEAAVMAVRPVLWILTTAMAVVLLIALVNLTALFRIRMLARDEELGVRSALGAGSVRLARVLGLEAVGLALAGASVGLLVAPYLLGRVREMIPVWVFIPDSAARVPALQAVLDPWVAVVVVVAAVAGTVLLTLPALVSTARDRRSAWGGRGGDARGTRWLVVAELALATVLCLGAALTARSAANQLAVDVGLQDEGLLTLYFADVWERPVEEQVAYFREVVDAVEAVPGVASAALIDYVPFQQEDDFARVYFLDREFQPVRELREEWRRVSEGLLETAGMRIVEGRSLLPEDFVGRPRSLVINRSFADKHYPGGGAVGSYVSTHDDGYRDMEIVGVVADVRSYGPARPAPPMMYVPLQGTPRGSTGMYVRSAGGDPALLAEAVQDAIWSVDSSEPVWDIAPMARLVSAWVAIPRAVGSLVGGVAALSLVLAAVGVFGVVGYAVRRRMREFGVRVALGASPDRLRRDVLVDAAPLVLVGVTVGGTAGVLGARGARAVLFGVAPGDPLSLMAAVALMTLAALLAVWLPARRASRVDPTQVLRAE